MLTSGFLKDYPGFDEPEYGERLAKMFRKDKNKGSSPKAQNIRENTPSSADKEKEAQEILGSYDFEKHIKSLFESGKLTPRPGSLVHFFNSSFGDGHSHYAAFKIGNADPESGDSDARLEKFYIGNEMVVDRQMRPNVSRLAKPCKSCGSENRLSDLERGESFCGDCGTVLGKILDRGTNTKPTKDYGEFLERLHNAPPHPRYGLGSVTFASDIQFKIRNSKQRTNAWKIHGLVQKYGTKFANKDKALRHARSFTKKIGAQLNLPQDFVNKVYDFYRNNYESDNLVLKGRGRRIKYVIGSLFYLLGLTEGNFIVPLRDVSKVLGGEKYSGISRTCLSLYKVLGIRKLPTIEGYLNYVSEKLGLGEDIRKRAIELNKSLKPSYGGTFPFSTAAALIFQARIDCGELITPREISHSIGVSESTLNKTLERLFSGEGTRTKTNIPKKSKIYLRNALKNYNLTIRDICKQFDLTEEVVRKAEEIFDKTNGYYNRLKKMAVAIHLASKTSGNLVVPIEDLIKFVPVYHRGVAPSYYGMVNATVRKLNLGFKVNPPENYINFYAKKLHLDKDIVNNAYEIVKIRSKNFNLINPHHIAVAAVYKALLDSDKEVPFIEDLNISDVSLRKYIGENVEIVSRKFGKVTEEGILILPLNKESITHLFEKENEAPKYILELCKILDLPKEKKNEAIDIWRKGQHYKIKASLQGSVLASLYMTLENSMSLTDFASQLGYASPEIWSAYNQYKNIDISSDAPVKTISTYGDDIKTAWKIMQRLRKMGIKYVKGEVLSEFISKNLDYLKNVRSNSVKLNIPESKMFRIEGDILHLPDGKHYSINLEEGVKSSGEDGVEEQKFYFGHTRKVEIKVTDRFHYLPTEQERNKFLEAVSRYSEVPVKDLANALREEHGWEKDKISSTQDYLHQTGAIEIEIRKTSRKEIPIKLVKLSAYGDKNPKEA